MVVARHAGVERDDPQAVDLVHPVLEAVVVGVEQPAGERCPLVVVAHRPDDDRAHLRGRRLDDRAQGGIGVGLGPVGEVAGEDQRLRRGAYGGQPVERPSEVGVVVDHAVVQAAATDQVRVGQVRDDVPGGGVLAELLHGPSLGPGSKAVPGLAGRSTGRRSVVGQRV